MLSFPRNACEIGMVISDIEPLIDRLPERKIEVAHAAAAVRLTQERVHLLLQAAQRALLRSQWCLAESPEKKWTSHAWPSSPRR